MDQPNASSASDSDVSSAPNASDTRATGDRTSNGRTAGVERTNVTAGDSDRGESAADSSEAGGGADRPRRRRRGSRGGQGRNRNGAKSPATSATDDDDDRDTGASNGDEAADRPGTRAQPRSSANQRNGDADATADVPSPSTGTTDSAEPDELPEPMREGRVRDPDAAASSLVPAPKIGDTRAAPVPSVPPPGPALADSGKKNKKSGDAKTVGKKADKSADKAADKSEGDSAGKSRRRRRGKGGDKTATVEPVSGGVESRKKKRPSRSKNAAELAAEQDLIEQRRGRERNGKPIGRYFMCVQVRPGISQVAVLEGRNLIEHYVSRPADDISQIHGNIYLGRVQNVLPGMEAAFIDIATPKNAVLYRGDVQYDQEDIVEKGRDPRIEDILRARQMILCQVTKNPIGAKGARLTQEVSLPGRFVVLIPNSATYGISKRLPDDTRKRLRNILDRIKPGQHGLIVRTAAEHATEADLEADMSMLLKQWNEIEAKAAKVNKPALLYREPELAVRVIREEFNADYRGVVIDDRRLYEEVRDYVEAFNPELADRIEYYDREAEPLSLFERHHVHEQVHKALDRKVWLPSGGSLIIEHTEALTVIDVNTGKNVGKSNLEETVFHNNMEAAEEIAKQLRLRDIGGIIVIDFIDMETKDNRAQVVGSFRDALARDKTRTQVFDISELGLVEMTRKRIGEGLLTEFSSHCPDCDGRGVVVDHSLLD